jgi:ribose transport system substrate-binding protein
MKRRILLSLTTINSDYQQEQAAAAESAALRLGVELKVIYADTNAITQSQQLLEVIQGPPEQRPDAIMFHPVGTGLNQVARAATAVGIGWAVINRNVEYIPELRAKCSAPIFSMCSNGLQIGQIQGNQMRALLPEGGLVLYIEGPSYALPAQQRTAGMLQTKPANVQIRSFKADWTEEGATRAVSAWLRLSTSRQMEVRVVAAQNDVMAMGARKAFQAAGGNVERWMRLPYLGCDGLQQTGAAWVRSGLLTGTVVIPAIAGRALEVMVNALETGVQPPEETIVPSHPLPEIEKMVKSRAVGI